VAITSVGQGYESMEGRHDYKTKTETTFGGQEAPMDIGKSNQKNQMKKTTTTRRVLSKVWSKHDITNLCT